MSEVTPRGKHGRQPDGAGGHPEQGNRPVGGGGGKGGSALEQLHARRFEGIIRPYTQAEVERLAGSVRIEYTLARMGAQRLWDLLHAEPYVPALGALTGNQAVQMAQAGLKAIYLSGWQVAADNNLAASMYPDQSLYPSNSVPTVVRRINNALQRADQIQLLEGTGSFDFWAPIVADAEAGFGGPLNAYELMLQLIEDGAAGVHLRGSACLREEMRPHGRQSAGARHSSSSTS